MAPVDTVITGTVSDSRPEQGKLLQRFAPLHRQLHAALYYSGKMVTIQAITDERLKLVPQADPLNECIQQENRNFQAAVALSFGYYNFCTRHIAFKRHWPKLLASRTMKGRRGCCELW